MTTPFMGETLRCHKCGFEQPSDVNIESGWYSVMASTEKGDPIGMITGKMPVVLMVKYCPPCFGNQAAPLCKDCNRFYHERYRSCPWCARARAAHS